MELEGMSSGESSTDAATAPAPPVAPEQSALGMFARAYGPAASADTGMAALDRDGVGGGGGERGTVGGDATDDGHYPLEEEAISVTAVAAAVASIAGASHNPHPATTTTTAPTATDPRAAAITVATPLPNGDEEGDWTTPNPAHPRKAKAGTGSTPEPEPEWEV